MAWTQTNTELRWRSGGRAEKIFGKNNKDLFEKFLQLPENRDVRALHHLEAKMQLPKWKQWLREEKLTKATQNDNTAAWLEIHKTLMLLVNKEVQRQLKLRADRLPPTA